MAKSKITAPLQLSEAFEIYMGKKKASRGEVIAKIWKDIKREPGYKGLPAKLPEVVALLLGKSSIKKVHEVTSLLAKAGAFEE